MNMPSLIPEPGSPIDRIATFLMANLMWVAFAAIIITLPAATAGLFATLAPWIRGKDTELFSRFFGTMRRQWLKSTVIAVIDVVIGVIVVFNFRAFALMGPDNLLVLIMSSVNLFVVMTVLMANLYIWPLLVLFDLPLRRLLNVSLRLVLGHPFWSFLVSGIVLLLVGVGLILPPVVTVLFLFSAIALVVNWGSWRIIQKYASPEELAELNSPTQS
jgi:uncharacterized membrane protein YesL